MAWTFFLLFLAGPVAGADPDPDPDPDPDSEWEREWERIGDESVIEIVTTDEDGDLRETPIWIVILDGRGYVRTNDSRWLANIRRGSEVVLRLDDEELPVAARERDAAEVAARVEASFVEKYGWVQRVMSWFRTREPTVLELSLR